MVVMRYETTAEVAPENVAAYLADGWTMEHGVSGDAPRRAEFQALTYEEQLERLEGAIMSNEDFEETRFLHESA